MKAHMAGPGSLRPIHDDDERDEQPAVAERPLLGSLPAVYARRRHGIGSRLLALAALAAFFATALGLALSSIGGGGGTKPRATPTATAPPTTAPTQPPAPPKPVTRTVRLTGAAAYDPLGDGHENDAEVKLATDGDRTTFWSTEHYNTWFKKGVGLVLDAGRPVKLTTLRVVSDDPGWTAEIQAGNRAAGPFALVSRSRTVRGTTAFALTERAPLRYYLIWITQLGPTPSSGGAAHVNEVTATVTERR
jgi:hypothetical protein